MLKVISVILFGCALSLWSVAGASMAGMFPVRPTGIEDSAAAGCFVLSGVGLMLDHISDGVFRYLVTAAISSRRGVRPTGPHRVPRPVRAVRVR